MEKCERHIDHYQLTSSSPKSFRRALDILDAIVLLLTFVMNLDEDIYSNVSPQSGGKQVVEDKRRCTWLVITLSLVLLLSLLFSAVMTYLYFNQKLAPATVPEVPSTKNCSSGARIEHQVQGKNKVYVLSDDQMTWNSSRECCRELGGDLVIVNSKEEHEFLARKVATNGCSKLHWIGLTDAVNEGVWLWVDQTPLSDNLTWWSYTPDDWKQYDQQGEDCVVYFKGKWGDVSCSSLARRICEIS